MAIYRSQKGNKWHLIIEEGETLRILISCHTWAVSVHELSDNDGD